jgi:hypothetical protein
LNILSSRLKRKANYGRDGGGEDDDNNSNNDDDNNNNNDDDNNNKGVPRKTLVTTTIWRESDATNANVPGRGGH